MFPDRNCQSVTRQRGSVRSVWYRSANLGLSDGVRPLLLRRRSARNIEGPQCRQFWRSPVSGSMDSPSALGALPRCKSPCQYKPVRCCLRAANTCIWGHIRPDSGSNCGGKLRMHEVHPQTINEASVLTGGLSGNSYLPRQIFQKSNVQFCKSITARTAMEIAPERPLLRNGPLPADRHHCGMSGTP